MSRMHDYCDIACDVCYDWAPGTEVSTRRQRHVLAKDGWKVRKVNGKLQDVCPRCAAEQKPKE